MTDDMEDRIMRLPEVKLVTGRCRSWIYAEIKAGRVPRQKKIGKRAVGWSRREIQLYIHITLDGGEYRAPSEVMHGTDRPPRLKAGNRLCSACIDGQILRSEPEYPYPTKE
jgi:prophage regulatory protein